MDQSTQMFVNFVLLDVSGLSVALLEPATRGRKHPNGGISQGRLLRPDDRHHFKARPIPPGCHRSTS